MEIVNWWKKNKLKVLLAPLVILVVLAIWFISNLPDGKLHLVFCDVGQGDAILVTTPLGSQILIDGGPDNKVLDCLGQTMPFYDRTVEQVILTHPQRDHLAGLIEVLRRFKVKQIAITGVTNQTAEFLAWEQALNLERAKIFKVTAGDSMNFGRQVDRLKGHILWPQPNFASSDLNETSIVLKLNFGRFCALLTGDVTNQVWLILAASARLEKCFLLKIAHHGSSNATNKILLDKVSPKLAVISVGKNNRFGHPAEEVIESLRDGEIKILRTDLDGTIEIVTDGEKVEVRD